MNILTTIPEKLKTAGRVVFHGQVTGTGDTKGISLSPGNGVCIFAIVTMGDATDLTLTVKTADDADGAAAVALTRNVAIYKNDVRQADGKALTITEATGVFTVQFCVPSIVVPAGKYLVLDFGNSNDANILSAVMVEDTYYEGDVVA